MDLICTVTTLFETFANKSPYSQSYGFSNSHVWMWELDYKESWVLKNWCFWTVNFWSIIELELLKYTSGICQSFGQIDGFSSSHVCMWELDHKESWAPKNWCFWTGVLEKTLESSLDCKEIKPVNPQGNQSWIFIGRTDAEAESPILWPPDRNNWLFGKEPDSGKDWRQEEKGMTEDEMVGWHHWLDGHEFE